MDKKKQQIIIAGVLVVVLIALIGNTLLNKPKPQAQVQSVEPDVSAVAPASVPQVQPMPETKTENKSTDTTMWGRDPFVLKEIGAPGTVISLRVMGITLSKNKKRMAIINNEMVAVGSKIGQYSVVRILKDRVVVTDGKENFDLLLEP